MLRYTRFHLHTEAGGFHTSMCLFFLAPISRRAYKRGAKTSICTKMCFNAEFLRCFVLHKIGGVQLALPIKELMSKLRFFIFIHQLRHCICALKCLRIDNVCDRLFDYSAFKLFARFILQYLTSRTSAACLACTFFGLLANAHMCGQASVHINACILRLFSKIKHCVCKRARELLACDADELPKGSAFVINANAEPNCASHSRRLFFVVMSTSAVNICRVQTSVYSKEHATPARSFDARSAGCTTQYSPHDCNSAQIVRVASRHRF